MGKIDKIKGKVVDFIKTNPRWKLSANSQVLRDRLSIFSIF